MVKEIKTKVTTLTTRIKRVIDNLEQFVQAASLLTVASYSYYATRELQLNTVVEVLVISALVVIGLRGAYEFFKFLDK